ncbi:MAG: FecR domain-containing protein [Thermodesulfobacteriota bacterium]
MKKRICLPADHLRSFFVQLLLLILLPLPAQAEEAGQAAATVVALRGNVQAVNAKGELRDLAVKSPIHNEDTIKTGKGGRLQILFSDNTIYSLGQNSEMKIAEYKWQPQESNGTLKTQVKEGVFRVMGGAITKTSPQNFTTETPAATIGIRGSMYGGTVTSSSLSVIFQGGKGIEVTNSFGTVSISRPGHGTSVTMNSAPEPPRQLSEQDVAAFSNELTAADGESAEEDGEQAAGAEEEETAGEAATEDEQATDGAEDEAAAQPAEETGVEEAAVDEPLVDEPVDNLANADIPAVSTVTEVPVPVIELPPPNEFVPAIDSTPAAATVPVDGIASYSGTATNTDGSTGTIDDVLWMEINWHNGRVLGRMKGKEGGAPAFFIGKVSGNQIVEVRIFGTNSEMPPGTTATAPQVITAISGSGSGTLAGTIFDLFSFSGSGASYEVEPANQPRHDTWTVQGAAGMEPQDPADVVSPRGVKTWKGFVVGLSEDMAAIDESRRLFMSSSPGDFAFTVDKDNGTLNGKLSAVDVNGSNSRLIGINLGGALASAFVLEDNFAAELGCTTGDCIYTGPATPTGMKKYGNYLLSAGPQDNILSDYVTWGYWEIAYQDPATGAQYHTHGPGSRWIAGEPTPVAEVNDLTNANFTGHYSGIALATKVDPAAAQQVSDLKGTVDITVDFGNIAAASAVQGVIDLGEIKLEVNSGAAGNASASGFSNLTNGVTGPAGILPNSKFNGAFYGPKAKAIAGNFHAPFSSGKSYTGIYGGIR